VPDSFGEITMAQIINTNIPSLNAQRNLNTSADSLATSLQRLSTGLRINSAKDDAAGLAISERFTTQIRGLNQAVRNANDGISFAQTAEGALGTIGDALQRIRELAVQSINDTNSTSDRAALNNEVSQLIAEVSRISSATQFNGQNILDGTLSNLTFQVGANQNQTISVDGVDARGSQLGARVGTTSSFSQVSLDALIAADDLVIQGTAIDLSGLAAGDNQTDLINAINGSSATSGVTALANTTNSVALTVAYTADTTNTFILNGVEVSFAEDTDAATSAQNLADALNNLSDQTGVTAEVAGAVVTLSNTTGDAFEFTQSGAEDVDAMFEATDATALADAGGTIYSGIQLASEVRDTDFTFAGTLLQTDNTSVSTASLAQGNQTLNGVDILSGANATEALLTLDFALNQVNGLRAELGAVQTRFESTISNLSITSENLAAARSRIQDADFAAETANLTRAQILQQAGTAILAQANALPQNVLSLLQ
jgi:flagellin